MADTYEVYVGKTAMGRNKSYFVANAPYTAVDAAKKVLKVTTAHIFVQPGWVIGEDLYLNNPKRKGQKKVWVASFVA